MHRRHVPSLDTSGIRSPPFLPVVKAKRLLAQNSPLLPIRLSESGVGNILMHKQKMVFVNLPRPPGRQACNVLPIPPPDSWRQVLLDALLALVSDHPSSLSHHPSFCHAAFLKSPRNALVAFLLRVSPPPHTHTHTPEPAVLLQTRDCV